MQQRRRARASFITSHLLVAILAAGCAGHSNSRRNQSLAGTDGGSNAGSGSQAGSASGANAAGQGGSGTGGMGGQAGASAWDGGSNDAGAPDAGACSPACGSHQHCSASVCACDTGYSGNGCTVCAPGYEKDASGAVCVTSSCGTGACAFGARKCMLGKQQLCAVDVSGCLAWGTAEDCAHGGCWCPTGTSKVLAQQWGGAGSDTPYGVTIGVQGEAIVTGWQDQSLPTTSMFVSARHLDPSASPDWTVSWGTHGVSDRGSAVSCNSNGEVFAAGNASAALAGQTLAGGSDLAVSKWNADHTSAWNTEWGTTTLDILQAIAPGAGGAHYVVGATDGALATATAGQEDMVLAKLAPNGQLAWTTQWGGAGRDILEAIAAGPQDALYVAGTQDGEAYCSKRDSSGAKVWETTWGTVANDEANGVVVLPSGEVLVVGYLGASDNPHGLVQGAFISKLDTAGSVLWTHALGLPGAFEANGIALGPSGDVYVDGRVQGELVTGAAQGSDDVFVYRLKTDGTVVWTKQVGSPGSDYTYGIAVAADETVFVVADTVDAFPGFVNHGMVDAVLLRITP